MAKTIGRLGYLGLGLESSPGTANTTPDVFIPYTENSVRGHHEPIEVIGTTSSRFIQRSSVTGKKWSEGNVGMDLDAITSGYLLKMAFGNEVLTTGTPNNHEFFVTASGNTPKTATFIYGRDTDVEQYSYVAINELTIEVSDGLATMSASVMGDFPTDGSVQTPTVTSGTVFAFPTFETRFGVDLTEAEGASDTPTNQFSITLSNELEMIYQSGQSNPVAIRTKGFSATGSYQVFFESEEEKDNYYNLTKRAIELKFTGNANEELRIRIPRVRLNEAEISTGIDDFFMVDTEFVVEDQIGGGDSLDSGVRFMDARLQNSKATIY